MTEHRVRNWKESKFSRNLEGVKREGIYGTVNMIKDEMNLKGGADQFVKMLQKTFTETTLSGDTMKVLGDLNDDTMIFAIFHCIEAARDNDEINIAYVINTLSTDLPRKNTRLNIAAVKDFAHDDLTEKMIENLTKKSEVELKKMTQTWPKRYDTFRLWEHIDRWLMGYFRDPGAGGGEHVDGPSISFKCKAKAGGKLEVTILSCQGLPDTDGSSNLTDAFVIVTVGTQEERTEVVKGKLDPNFNEETSTFLFDVRSLITV